MDKRFLWYDRASCEKLYQKLYGIMPHLCRLPASGRLFFSAKIYAVLNPDLKFSSRAHAFRHFRVQGYRQLRQFSDLNPFDAKFYKDYYVDLQHFDHASAYAHWLTHGIKEKRVQSAQEFLQRLEFPSSVLPDEIAGYLREESTRRTLDYWRLVEDFLEGKLLSDVFWLGSRVKLVVLKELFRFFSNKRHAEAANLLAEMMFERFPDDPYAMHLVADRQMSSGQYHLAKASYAKVFRATESYSIWCRINSVEIFVKYHDYDSAIDCCIDGLKKFPGSERLRTLLRSCLLARFDRNLLNIRRIADVGASARQLSSAIAELRKGFEIIYAMADLGAYRGHRSVAIIGGTKPTQCYEYRIRQKIQNFASIGVTAEFFDFEDCSRFVARAWEFDIVIFYRMPAWGSVLEALFAAENLGSTTIYEIDDLILDPVIYPPEYVSFGGFVMQDEMHNLRFDAISFSALASQCDYGVASTTDIADHLQNIVRKKRCFVVMNGLFVEDIETSSAQDEIKKSGATDKRVTIFYGSGARSHSSYFTGGLADALVEVMKANPCVDLAIVGPLFLDDRFRHFGGRVRRTEQGLSRSAYLDVLKTMSINLLPLADDVFSSAKSNIKWLEAAVRGVATVASDNASLRNTVRPDEIVFCRDAKSWKGGLTRLIGSREEREAMASRARHGAIERFSPSAVQEQLRSVLDEVAVARPDHAIGGGKRILAVNVSFAPQAYGGATRVMLDDALDLNTDVAGEFDIAVFTSIDGLDRDMSRIYVHDEILVCGVSAPQRAEALDKDLGVADKFERFVKLYKPDLIHFHCIQMLSASLLDVARWHGIPYVITVHDGWWISDFQFLMHPDGRSVLETCEWGNTERLARLKDCLEGARTVFAVSDVFAKIYKGRCDARIVTLENRVRPLNVVKRPEGKALRLGLIGGFGVAKGADLLQAALRIASFANLEFDVVDHHAEEGSCREVTWGTNKVRILGRFSQHNVAKFYEEIDVLCSPSVCVESFGLSVREALTAGRWVIVSDRGALQSAVQPGKNGFVVDVDDPADLLKVLSLMNGRPSGFKRDSSGLMGDLDTSRRFAAIKAAYRSVLA